MIAIFYGFALMSLDLLVIMGFGGAFVLAGLSLFCRRPAFGHAAWVVSGVGTLAAALHHWIS